MKHRLIATIGLLVLVVVTALSMPGCGDSGKPAETEVLASFPVDSMDGVMSRTGIEFDKQVTSDGNGSLKLTTGNGATFDLYQVTDLSAENCRLIYKARVRTEGVKGIAYLEAWVNVPGSGRYFSRGLDQTLSGTNEWSTLEIPFTLKKGQMADSVQLDLVVEDGEGTVWIDEVELLQNPLQ